MVKREYTFKDKADFMEKIADIDGVEFFEDDFVLINNVKFLEESIDLSSYMHAFEK